MAAVKANRSPSWLLNTPIAHRGLHGPGAPELSRAALLRAVEAGVAAEIDVRLCRDGIVVIHDEDTERVTGVRRVVSESSFSQLRALSVLDSSAPLPSLSEVLEFVNGRVPLLIEIKHRIPAAQIGPAVLATLAGYKGDWAIQSFDPRIVRWFRQHAPSVPRGQISGDLSRQGLGRARRFVLETMLWNVVTRPDFVVWDVDELPNRLVSIWSAVLRCTVLAWTVQTEQHLARARRAGAGLIFEHLDPASLCG